MNRLVIHLNPRPRRAANGHRVSDPGCMPAKWRYVAKLGVHTEEGEAEAGALPRAENVVAILPAEDLGWHYLDIPKVPMARMRTALVGVLEDFLIDDVEEVHFALAPETRPGNRGWVATTHRHWLASQLQQLETAGVIVERVVPEACPSGVFAEGGTDAAASVGWGHIKRSEDQSLRLIWSDGKGALSLDIGMHGERAKTLLPAPLPPEVRWTAEPDLVDLAQRCLDQPVHAVPAAQRALATTNESAPRWNLRQFDLVSRRRGVRLLREQAKALLSPVCAPARYGLLALLAVNLAGLNLTAWNQHARESALKQASVQLLQKAYPDVRAVLDAPVQMARATEQLRARAGKPGSRDLEPLMEAVGAAWPANQQADGLHFRDGQLKLDVPTWGEEDKKTFAAALQREGLQVERDGASLRVRLQEESRP